MSAVSIVVETKIKKSFRVKQLEAIFDVPVTEKISHSWDYDADIDLQGEWNIGMFVGPSASGKTTLLKKLYSKQYHKGWKWTSNAVVDNISEAHSIQDITKVFSSVGFSSPPSWVKPYRVLSNGEKFRVDLARCILDGPPTFVFDEFSSVVDRDVAKVTSSAVSKAVRTFGRKMIVASCHYDIIRWLEPDWVYDLRDYTLTRRRLRRPPIKLEICESERSSWEMFRQHHYLSANLNQSAKCFGSYWQKDMIGFCAVLPAMGRRGVSRVHRLVVLPDYQGIGIGYSLLTSVAKHYADIGRRMTITSSHPSVIKGLDNKAAWRLTNFYRSGTVKHGSAKRHTGLDGRPGSVLASYEYVRNKT